MFAARTSLLPTSAMGGEVGAGGSDEIAFELNRIYADPSMPNTSRKHSMIPGVGASGRSTSADQQQPNNTTPLLLAISNTANSNSNYNANNNKATDNQATEDFSMIAIDSKSKKSQKAGMKSPPYSPRSGTTSGFEDDRLNTRYKLGWRRTLHNKRRQVADYSTIVALIGISIMVLETELSMAGVCSKVEFCSIFLKSFVSLSTLVLIGLLLYYHYIEIEIFKVDNSVDDWRIAVSPLRVVQIMCEIFICIIHPIPVDWNIKMYAISDSAVKEVRVSLDVVLGVPMFLRLYLLARLLLLHSRLFTDASSRSIGALNRITFNARFVLKTLMTMCPGTVLMTFILTMFIIGSWILRICETAHNPAYYNLLNSMWLVSITFLAVGYGDFAPETYCGRTVAVFSGFMGAGCTALVVAVVARKLELTRSEKHVHNFMMNTQLSKRLKDSAANVLRETWLIFKYSKLVARPSPAKIREHQRKFLTAIKSLRKVKLEQRKIAEQCHNLVDFPKVLMGISDAVVEARGCTIDNMSLVQRRLDSVEKDVLEVKAHLLSIQSGLLQMMADFREANASSQAIQQLQLQLLQLRAGEQLTGVGGQIMSFDYNSPSMDVVPSTTVLVSPPDYQHLSDPGNATGPPKFQTEPAWLRRHMVSGAQVPQQSGLRQRQPRQESEEKDSKHEDKSSLWSHSGGGSAQTVVHMGRVVPRAASAMESVETPSPTHANLPQRQSAGNIAKSGSPTFSSAVQVSLDPSPPVPPPTSTFQIEMSPTRQIPKSEEQKPKTPLTSASSAGSSSASSSAKNAAAAGEAPLVRKSESKL